MVYLAHFLHSPIAIFCIYYFKTEEWLSPYRKFSVAIFRLLAIFFATDGDGLFSPRSHSMASLLLQEGFHCAGL